MLFFFFPSWDEIFNLIVPSLCLLFHLNYETKKSFAFLDSDYIACFVFLNRYRGYCPQIKYRVGKTYGTDTHELAQVNSEKLCGHGPLTLLIFLEKFPKMMVYTFYC